MDAYSKSDQEAEMLAAFHSLATHGLQPNRYTYTTLLRHFAKKGDMASLLKYYGEAMARDDICTEDGDSGIHDMVLLGTVAVKDVETSMEVYDGMASGALPPPELYTLDILLKLCLEHKLENFALMLMRDMSKFGIDGDSR
jgi:pentatricopeptide repeat protein